MHKEATQFLALLLQPVVAVVQAVLVVQVPHQQAEVGAAVTDIGLSWLETVHQEPRIKVSQAETVERAELKLKAVAAAVPGL